MTSLVWASDVTAADSVQNAVGALGAVEDASRMDTEAARARRMSSVYETRIAPLLGPDFLRSADRAELAALFDATYRMAFYTDQPRYRADLERFLPYFGEKGPLTDRDARRYFRALVQARKFSQAASFSDEKQLAGEEAVPVVLRLSDARAMAYRVHRNSDVLVETRPSLSGTLLVFVSHPRCAFSQRAEASLAEMIDASKHLSERFIRLAPVGPRLYLADFRDWNAINPGNEILITRDPSDWPMIEDWATPNFYLLQDGQVIDHFSGWPREGNEARLRQLLARFEACLAGTCPAP